MLHFSQRNPGRSRKISAHRQTWMNTDALDMTPATKLQTEQNILNTDQQFQSRYRDDFAAQRASMTIYELIDAENVRARQITSLIDSGETKAAERVSKQRAPIAEINELLEQSNLPIKINIRKNEQLVASKSGGPEYNAAQLSDGERNALLIAASVLTAEPGTLLIIDEPERHLHRSIISPLLGQLFQIRSDCAFVVSTHDHGLPLELPTARTLLLRDCIFDGQNVRSWESDELPLNIPIDDSIKRDLLGARQKVVFVEGTEESLDRAIYSLVFPMISVIPKGSCKDVERAVVGVGAAEGLHWLHAFGIVDGDGYEPDQIREKRDKGIYALPFYSIEAIYFHPTVIQRIAARMANISGAEPSDMAQAALAAGVSAIADHTERLSKNAAKKSIRKLIIEQIPNDDDLLKGDPVTLQNDASSMQEKRKEELDAAVMNDNWEVILTKCPVRESCAMSDVSAKLGFREVRDYEKAVRELLSTDDDAVNFARSLFDDLYEQLNA